MNITATELRDLMHYDPDTGFLFWRYLGVYPTIEAAKDARDRAAIELFGQFARTE